MVSTRTATVGGSSPSAYRLSRVSPTPRTGPHISPSRSTASAYGPPSGRWPGGRWTVIRRPSTSASSVRPRATSSRRRMRDCGGASGSSSTEAGLRPSREGSGARSLSGSGSAWSRTRSQEARSARRASSRVPSVAWNWYEARWSARSRWLIAQTPVPSIRSIRCGARSPAWRSLSVTVWTRARTWVAGRAGSSRRTKVTSRWYGSPSGSGSTSGVPEAAARTQNCSSASGLSARTSARSVRSRGLRTAVVSGPVGPSGTGVAGGFLRGG